jgi:hypothetical protein
METESSLPHSQEPATCPYPEPAQSSPWPSHPTSSISFPTFHVPKLMSLFRSWGHNKESVQVRGVFCLLRNIITFYREELLEHRPTPKLEDHPL